MHKKLRNLNSILIPIQQPRNSLHFLISLLPISFSHPKINSWSTIGLGMLELLNANAASIKKTKFKKPHSFQKKCNYYGLFVGELQQKRKTLKILYFCCIIKDLLTQWDLVLNYIFQITILIITTIYTHWKAWLSRL